MINHVSDWNDHTSHTCDGSYLRCMSFCDSHKPLRVACFLVWMILCTKPAILSLYFSNTCCLKKGQTDTHTDQFNTVQHSMTLNFPILGMDHLTFDGGGGDQGEVRRFGQYKKLGFYNTCSCTNGKLYREIFYKILLYWVPKRSLYTFSTSSTAYGSYSVKSLSNCDTLYAPIQNSTHRINITVKLQEMTENNN